MVHISCEGLLFLNGERMNDDPAPLQRAQIASLDDIFIKVYMFDFKNGSGSEKPIIAMKNSVGQYTKSNEDENTLRRNQRMPGDILIIDDDFFSAEFMRQSLLQLRTPVLVAPTARAAHDALVRYPVALVLLDAT